MNRRQALKTMMSAMGLASASQVFGASAFLMSSATSALRPVLGVEDIKLLEAVADTILPTTEDSPGAKAAGIGAFMQAMVSDYYTVAEQQIFLRGLGSLSHLSKTQFNKNFLLLNGEQREQLLLQLEQDEEASYYRMAKQLTVWGYFSSEVGAKQALRFAPIPGRYDGEVKIEPGTKAWANLLA